MKHINLRLVVNTLGALMIITGVFMLTTIPFGLWWDEHLWDEMCISSISVIIPGIIVRYFSTPKSKDIGKKEGYLIVVLGWLVMVLCGSVPFMVATHGHMFLEKSFVDAVTGEVHLNYTDAFFETMSGFTTTGASILPDIEAMPHCLLFWRSLTHWLGGMGIIVLTVAILPMLGIGGMQLFVAEAPGPQAEKLHPRIKETAKRLWAIYIILTLAETVLLQVGGMSFFDAINHALATMATGGFSTKNDSIAHFNSPFIQYTIIIFMFLAGTNFTLTYFGFKGRFKKIIKNEEFKVYLLSTLFVIVCTTITILLNTDMKFEESFRDASFQVVSIITTTGFVSDDYTSWHTFTTTLFFVLLFTGACAGSTSGGIKVVRHLILIKNSFSELKRQLHPSAIIPVRFNGKAVTQSITYNIAAFILIYLLIFFLGALVMSTMEPDFDTAVGSTIACLGNIGPGIGHVGPVDNFSKIPDFGKWVLSFLMLLGRLELFTVLMIFTRHFWKRN